MKNLEKQENEKVTLKEEYQKEIKENNKELCHHIKNINKEQWEKISFTKELKQFHTTKKKNTFNFMCFSCSDKINTYEELKSHSANNHNIFINISELTIVCMKCKEKFNMNLIKDKLSSEQKIIIQSIIEDFPDYPKFLTEEEIYEIKYNQLISDFISGKYKKIIFMVGAGISTSAGIPDFRSSNGLYKQLQEKYHLSTPEEFFLISTFRKNPKLFYEVSKISDLSNYKPTISHKFMSFLTKKNYVKYIFTQNVDGLEIKAKIPKEKLVFAHGNSSEGHCANCHFEVDIAKINEGINKGEVYYCPKCNGPCKPKVVFYGESLPLSFFEKLKDINDIDLIIIMGTSLKVYPFAGIPRFVNPNVGIVVFNMEKVGDYEYDKINMNNYFIKGKTDDIVLKFLKDIKLYDEFEKFIKNEFGEELNKIIGIENKMMNVKDVEANGNNSLDKLSKEFDKLNL